MRFSIIVPLHNCETTIVQAISCFKTQNFPRNEFEIICIDDKSTDKSVKLVKKAKVKLIKLSNNQGNGKAKNSAIRNAKGEILVFIDDHLYLEKNALLNLHFLFKKNPDISGICGYYESLRKSDMNICRDIRRRIIYGKNDKEKEISIDSFLPFSIGIGAIRREIFKRFIFPEDFGKNSAEDTYLQICCHCHGKKFLYSPLIKGLHDHNLGYNQILNKLFVEIRGVGDLLSCLIRKNIDLPFQYCFLSYPLFLIMTLFLTILNRDFLPFFLMFLAMEIFLTAQCFKDKERSISLRFKAFTYCLVGEIIKGFYLPYYLIKTTDLNITILMKTVYQFLQWEENKLNNFFHLLLANRQGRLKYA